MICQLISNKKFVPLYASLFSICLSISFLSIFYTKKHPKSVKTEYESRNSRMIELRACTKSVDFLAQKRALRISRKINLDTNIQKMLEMTPAQHQLDFYLTLKFFICRKFILPIQNLCANSRKRGSKGRPLFNVGRHIQIHRLTR